VTVTVLPDDRYVLLPDGRSAHIRALRGDDANAVQTLYRQSSEWSRYLRFFSPVPVDTAVRLTRPPADDGSHCMLAAEVDGRVVGLGEYDLADDAGIAEVAFMVVDDEQGHGIGTALLESLVQRAAVRGIRRFRASYLRQNDRMPDVFAHAGFNVHWDHRDAGVGGVDFELVPTDSWTEAHAHRVDVAQARSIARLLSPGSIAVVGAGRDERSIGRAIVTNLVEGGFEGPVYPVNEHPVTITGRPAVPSVLDVDGPVDLAVVAVPAAEVIRVAEQCAAKGVHGLVVLSGGFAELDDGAARQRELVALCRHAGMRLVGPNCVGIVNTDAAVRMNATFSPVAPVPGRVGCASQSGGVGIELLARAHELGLGVSTFVSMGNKADVSGNDLMQYWAEDPATDVVLLYLESFGNPRTFARVARQLARRKPVVALKSGRSTAGARGSRSHTAALADPDAAVDALLRQTGVVRVDTLAELFDTAMLLAHQPVPAGRRVAVVSNGGGPGIVAADACAAAGLQVPELSSELQGALRALAPSGGVENPVDLIAAASAAVFEQAVGLLLASGEIDALIAIYVAPYVTHGPEIEAAIVRAVTATPNIPVAGCLLGLDDPPSVLPVPGSAGVPTFAYPEAAAQALAHAAWLGEWRQRPTGNVPPVAIDHALVETRIARALADLPPESWVPPEVALGVLADAGITVVRSATVSSAADAVAAADAMGFPTALKAVAPGLVHKSDVGGVRLGLTDGDAVRAAYLAMGEALEGAMTSAVVQPMVPPGVELIVGMRNDTAFGPVVVLGMGGVTAELQHDVALAIPPLTDVDIDELLRALRASPLLFGYRNAPPVDVRALADLLARIAHLAGTVEEITELDCNPVVVSAGGAVVVDAKLRLAPRPSRPSPFALE
jgi:acyl-CoA synthetase (NDP forming)/RimJ/RimL family protein N-acetyltransferase